VTGAARALGRASHCVRTPQTAVLQKLSRWSALEAARQEEEEQAALEQESRHLSMDQRTAAGRQLFNPQEAFTMVSTHSMIPV